MKLDQIFNCTAYGKLGQFTRYSFYCTNLLSMLLNIAAIGCGFWVLLCKKQFAALFEPKLFVDVGFLLLFIGAISMCMNVIGFYVTSRELRCFMYAVSMELSLFEGRKFHRFCIAVFRYLLSSVSDVTDGWCNGIHFSKTSKLVVNALDLQMLTSLKTFYGQPADDAVTDAWDKMQEQFHCCGIDETQKSNFIIWRTSKWHMDQPEKLKKLVPASCCVKLNGQYVDINACQMFDPDSKVNTTAIYTEGCYRRFEKHLFQISSIEGTLGILASLFLIKPSFFCALLARLTQK
ncbi:Tetraspanin-11 [Trichinella nelsoni]|uniref:Tetraspanin-11 n=1 Tax=Trichinella nelsoni TaxID=6336 RepID=A0A0V0SE61_9BILA|nr:Tetraspanin-11 [Trichinella nelsoni]